MRSWVAETAVSEGVQMVALTDDSLVEPKVVPMVEKSVDLMVELSARSTVGKLANYWRMQQLGTESSTA